MLACTTLGDRDNCGSFPAGSRNKLDSLLSMGVMLEAVILSILTCNAIWTTCLSDVQCILNTTTSVHSSSVAQYCGGKSGTSTRVS